jgi:hypothetical protein
MANVYKTDSSTGEMSKYVFDPSTGSGSYIVMTSEEIAKQELETRKRNATSLGEEALKSVSTTKQLPVYDTSRATNESSIGTDIKRVALSTLEAPFELASDLLVRPFSADKEKYDARTAEKFKNVKTGLLGLIGDDTEEEVAEIIDPRTGDTRTPDTFTGQVLDIGTYLVGGGLLFKGLGKITKLGKATRGVIAEQATEQLLTDPNYNMSNLVQDLKEEPNAVVDYLAADKNDDVLLNRAKLVLTSGLFAGSLAGIYKLGFSAVNVEKSSRKLFGKPAKELTDEQLPEVMGELLSQQKRKGNSKIVKAVKKAAEDDEKGIAQIIDQSTNSVSGKLKWFKQRWMQSRGFLSNKGFEAQQEGIASQKELISKAGHIAYRLQSFIDNVGTTAKSETLTNKIADALETGNTKGLSKEVTAEIISARTLIDDLSSTILDNNIGGEVLRRSIEKNMGQYIRRSYRLFEDKNFVPDASLYEDAVDALVASRTKGKKEISAKALKKYEADARSSLDSLLERGEKQSFNDYVAKMQQIKKGYFKGRKDIDPAVRKLMGEIESPTENIILTAQKLGSITENHKFYNTLENLGGSTPASPTLFNSAVKAAREELKNVDIEDVQKTFKEGTYVTDLDDSLGKIIKVNKNGSYKVTFKDSITGKKKTRTVASSNEIDLVSPDKAVSRRATEIYEEGGGSFTKEKYIFESKNGVFNTQIQGTGSSLDGKFTTKDMARAVNNLEDTHLLWGAFANGLKNQEVVRYFAGAKGFNQQMRTVYDHTTHLRNALGGFQFGLANGLNPIAKGRTNFNVLYNEITKGGNKVFDNFYERLQGLGVVNTSVRAGEARALLDIAAESNPAKFAARLGGYAKKYSGVNTAHKYFVKRPEDIYMATDDFFKMNAFVTELETLKIAKPKASLDALEKEAAELIKQTFPNYDRVFKGVKALRELPVGNFVSFPAEILRTSFNIARQGFKEITSGNKALMARGTKRLTGFATMNLGYYAIGSAGWSTLGFSKQENEALNTLNEGFTDSPKSYAKVGDDMLVQDNNNILAYAALVEPVMEALRKTNKGIALGESDAVSLRQGVLSGMRTLTKSFTDEAMLTTALWDLGSALKSDRNATSKGKQLWTDDSNMVEGMFSHVIDSFAPGVFLDVRKLREAVNEVPNPTTGLTRSIPARLLEFGTGLNFRKFTPQNQFTYKVKDYIGAVNFKTTKAQVKFDKEGSDFFEEYTIEQSRRFKASQELYRHIEAMSDLGYSNRVISNILKDNGVSSFNERLSLLQGKFVPREISADDKFNIKTKMSRDSKVFETLDSLRTYTDFIAGTSLEPDSDFQKRKSQIIRKKISLDDFQKRKYATGGEVDVPNAPTEPDERIDKLTGLPYNVQAGEAYRDEEDPLRRLGFMGGGAVKDPLVRLGFAQGSEVQTFGTGDIRPEIQAEAIEPVETFGTGDIRPDIKAEKLPLVQVKNKAAKNKQLQIVKSLTKLGSNNKAISAIVGNSAVETGYTFDPFQVENTRGKKGDSVGHGIFQLTTGANGKKQYYDMWLKNKNVPDSLEAQIQFMDDTIYGSPDDTTMYGKDRKGNDLIGILSIIGRKNAEKLRKVLEGDDLTEMTRAFSEVWEKPKVPNLEDRLAYSQSFFNNYSLEEKVSESLEQKIRGGDPEIRQILKEVNESLPYTPKPADKDFLKSAVETLELRFANKITTPETILRLGSSVATNITSPIANAVGAVADATGVTDAIGYAVEKVTDTDVYKESKAKVSKWVQENPGDAEEAERILEDLVAVINIFGTGYGAKTLFGAATTGVNKAAVAMPTKIEGFYARTGIKGLDGLNQFRAAAKVATKSLAVNTLETLKRLTGTSASVLPASKRLAIRDAGTDQRIVDKNFQPKSLFDPKGVPKFTTKDGKPITEIPPLGTPLFDVKGQPVIKANVLERAASEIITATLIKKQADLKPFDSRPTIQQYASDILTGTKGVPETLTTKYKHPDLPIATAAEQATLMKHLTDVNDIDPTTFINVLRGDSLQKITPTIFKSNQIGASSLQKKMFGNKERKQWAEFIKNTDPATGLPINEKGFISLLNKARLNKLNSSEIDSIISNASPAQIGGWLEFKLATPKDIRAIDVLSKFVKREPLPIPDPKRTGKKGFKVTYRNKDGNPTTDKSKATNITLQDSNDIGAQELGGVNLYFNLNLNDGIARITLSDKHDIFGMKPLGGKNLVNVSAEHGWSYRNLTKYPPTSVRNIAEESQTALKLLKDNGATIKDGNLIFKQNKKTVSVPLIGKMQGASMKDLTNLANGEPSKFRDLAVSVDTTLLGYK